MLRVLSTRSLNGAVTRLTLERDVSIDLPDVCGLAVASGDTLKVEVDPASRGSFDCILQGVVYDVVDGFSFISCGGMLVKVDRVLSSGADVRVALAKSRRRTRAASGVASAAKEPRPKKASAS